MPHFSIVLANLMMASETLFAFVRIILLLVFSFSVTVKPYRKITYSCVCHMEKLSPFASKQTAKTV
jgi:hypothetical protein